jgi:hypothetical protein
MASGKNKALPPPSKPASKKKAQASAKTAAKRAHKENQSSSATTSGSKTKGLKQKKRADTPHPDVTPERIAAMQECIKELEGVC